MTLQVPYHNRLWCNISSRPLRSVSRESCTVDQSLAVEIILRFNAYSYLLMKEVFPRHKGKGSELPYRMLYLTGKYKHSIRGSYRYFPTVSLEFLIDVI